MNEIIEKVLLKESIEFNGSTTDLKEKLSSIKERKFKFEWISDTEFKILSNLSIGTLIMELNPEYFEGIKGFGKLTELENGKIKIDLSTKLRIEFYFMTIIPILSIIVSFFFVVKKYHYGVFFYFLLLFYGFGLFTDFKKKYFSENL